MTNPFDPRPMTGLQQASTCNLSSIPVLLQKHGNLADTCRATGICENTLRKFRFDFECREHIIVNGYLMTWIKSSPRIYSRPGTTRSDRAKLEDAE